MKQMRQNSMNTSNWFILQKCYSLCATVRASLLATCRCPRSNTHMKWLCCRWNRIIVILLTGGVLMHLTASNNIAAPRGVFRQAQSLSLLSRHALFGKRANSCRSKLWPFHVAPSTFFFFGGLNSIFLETCSKFWLCACTLSFLQLLG